MQASTLKISDIMMFWTATIVVGIILQVIIQMMQTGSALGQF